MRILHTVENYYPSIGGMQEVVQKISEYLVSHGHEVTVATSKVEARNGQTHINGVKIVEFSIKGNRASGFVFGEVNKYQQFLLESDFDLVVNFAAQQWATDLALPILRRIRGKKVFVPTGFAGLFNPEYAEYYHDMRTWIHHYDSVVCHSNDYRDNLFLKENDYSNQIVIHNGASEAEFGQDIDPIQVREKWGISKDARVVLLVGSHTGAKGHKEAINAYIDANIDNSVLVIVGNKVEDGCQQGCERKARIFNLLPFVSFGSGSKGALKSLIKGIITLKFLKSYFQKRQIKILYCTRSETVELFLAADLFFFPSNIECAPIVLVEAMAAGLPFLASNVGNAVEMADKVTAKMAILPTHYYRGYASVNVPETSKMLKRVIEDKEYLKAVAATSRKVWLSGMTWQHICQQYSDHYLSLLQKS